MLFVFMALRLGWACLSSYLVYMQIYRREYMGRGVLSKMLFDRCLRYLTRNVTPGLGWGFNVVRPHASIFSSFLLLPLFIVGGQLPK
jgi:hypothetical protein